MEQNNTAPARRRLTKRQLVTLIIVGVLAVGGIAIAASMNSADSAITKNGIEATATSTGQYLQTRDSGKRSAKVYKAQYTFTDAKGSAQFVYGEKMFPSIDDITKGKTVTVKYLESAPQKSLVTSGE